jgi:hypothetical protein
MGRRRRCSSRAGTGEFAVPLSGLTRELLTGLGFVEVGLSVDIVSHPLHALGQTVGVLSINGPLARHCERRLGVSRGGYANNVPNFLEV